MPEAWESGGGGVMSRDNWNWYLKRGDKEYGPLSHRELLLLAGLGKVQPSDQMWAVGFPSWVPAHFITGLLRPPLAPRQDILDWSSWQPTLRRLKASWFRFRRKAARVARRADVPQFVPMIWCSVACVGVLAIAISERTSAHSFALDVPEISKAEEPRRPAIKHDTAHVRPTAAAVVPVSYSPMPKKLPSGKDDTKSVAEENYDTDDAIPFPPRKPIADAPMRSLQTKAGARAVQRRLRDLGYLADNADGSWGARSRFALKQFQARAKVAPNGEWSRKAERVLFSASAPPAAGSVSNPIVETLFRHD